MIYFIFSPDDPRSLVKIGYTGGSVEARIAQMQTGCPFRLVTIMAIDGDRRTERLLHQKFAADRFHGEWFLPSEPLRAFIRDTLGTRLSDAIARTLADSAAVEWQARVLGWEPGEVRAGLLAAA